jgi:hypothetical protein
MFRASVRLLLTTLCFFTVVFSASAKNDSLLKSIQVGYFTFNDNNLADNHFNEYDDRKRDDLGLTYLLGYSIETRFNFFKKSVTSIGFTDHSVGYTKGRDNTTPITAKIRITMTINTFS